MVLTAAGFKPRRVNWPQAWRIVASRYPPIDLFERVSPDPAVWDALIAAEQLVNPRIRDEIGIISLVARNQRVSGPGASYVMAPFTHLNPKGSRFADAAHGANYCANRLQTAIAETVFHFSRFARDSNDPRRREDMRVLVGPIDGLFVHVTDLPEADRRRILDSDDYSESQGFARTLRGAGHAGVCYPSVRDAGSHCLAAFRPDAVGIPVQERHLSYEWDGTRVTRYFDYSQDRWQALTPP